MKKLQPVWGDAVVLALFILLGIGGLFYNIVGGAGHDQNYVQIYVENELIKEYSLTDKEEATLTVEFGPDSEYEAEVQIKDGKVRMLPIDEELCPRGICAHTGWIQHYGESIVCLPNRIMVVFEMPEDEDENGVDGITY